MRKYNLLTLCNWKNHILLLTKELNVELTYFNARKTPNLVRVDICYSKNICTNTLK